MSQRPLWAPAGATFFTRSDTLLGRLIRWGETDPGETNGTWTNHTGVVVESGWLVPPAGDRLAPLAVVVEALWKTQRVAWWTAHGEEVALGLEIRAFRPVPEYDVSELDHFRREAESYVGDTYGWWKLLVMLADRALFKGRKVLANLLFVKRRPICSFLAAFANQKAQSTRRIVARLRAHAGKEPVELAAFPFGMAPQAADPDEMMDYALAHPGEWQEEVQ